MDNEKEEWYLAKDNKRLGPFAFHCLKAEVTAGRLQRNDMVFRSGERKWRLAESVPGLFTPTTFAGTQLARVRHTALEFAKLLSLLTIRSFKERPRITIAASSALAAIGAAVTFLLVGHFFVTPERNFSAASLPLRKTHEKSEASFTSPPEAANLTKPGSDGSERAQTAPPAIVGANVPKQDNVGQTEHSYKGRTAAQWAKLLQSNNFKEYRLAADSLGQMGSRAKSAIPDLMKALHHPNRWDDYSWVGNALARIGKPAVPAIRDELKKKYVERPNTKEFYAVTAMINALRRIGPDAEEAIPELSRLCKAKASVVAKLSAKALQAIQLSEAEWLQRARDLHAKGDHGEAVRLSTKLISLQINDSKNNLADVQFLTQALLLRAAANAKLSDNASAISDLTEAIRLNPKNYETYEKRAILYSITGQGQLADADRGEAGRLRAQPNNSHIEAMLERLCDKSALVRYNATFEISQIGKRAVEPLIRELKKQGPAGPEASVALISALGLIGADAQGAKEAILERFAATEPDVRVAAATALGRIGASSDAVLSALIGSFADKNEEVRLAALQAICTIGRNSESAVAKVIQLMSDPSPRVRQLACLNVKSFGTLAKSAIPKLRQLLSDSDPAMRLLALFALKGLGENAELAVRTTPVIDLAAAMAQAGFVGQSNRSIHDYLLYGSRKMAERASTVDQFGRLEIEDRTAPHRERMRSTLVALRKLAVQIPTPNDFETKGLVVTCRLGIRLDVDGLDALESPTKEGAFSENLLAIHPSWATGEGHWFLTKSGQLQACRTASEVFEVEKMKGFLFLPDGPDTDLVLRLSLALEDAKSFVRQYKNYTIDLIADEVEVARPFEWGYYRKDRLLEAAGNCRQLIRAEDFGGRPDSVPEYFRPEGVPVPKLALANLVRAVLRDSRNNIVAEYTRRHDYGDLVLVPPEIGIGIGLSGATQQSN